MWCWPFLIGGLQPKGPQQPSCWQSPSYFQSERLTLPSNKMGQKSRHKREKMRERMRKDDGKVMACWLAGNHFTCYRKPLKSLKPPPERPGLLLLNRNGRHVIGAPLINPELGKPPVSHGGYLYLKTTARDARNYCDSAPGTIRIQHGCPDNKIPGLALDSEVLKVRDSVPQQQQQQEEQSTNVLFDSRPRSTLSQDKLFYGESPSVGNIKKHPGIYPLRQEEAVCQEPTMKVAKVKPRLTVMEQHCQEHITKQIKGLLLQKHKAKAQRTRKSHTCQETKPNLGKEGRTVASERPQIRKKKQPLCFTGVLTSGGKKFCPQRKKGTGFAKSVHQKVQKMGPSTPITPSQESEKIWDLDKALEFIEGAPLIHKKDSKMKKKAPGTIRIPPGCPDKEVPGLDLSSKVLKAETMKEQEEEEEEQQQQKQQEEEQEEEVEDEKNWIQQKKKQVKRDKAGEVWHEFDEFLENEAFPNYEIVKRRPKKTRQVRQEKEKTVKWRWSEMKEEELQEQDEGEKIQKLEVIVKKRPKRTPKKKVS